MNAKELAELVLKTLEVQQKYFKAPHGTYEKQDHLREAKKLESELKREATKILKHDPQKELFF